MTLRYSMAAFAASARFGLAGIAGISALAGGLATPNAAHATVVSFSASGSGSDGPLAATAQFTTGAGFIDITLTNALAASVIISAGQALSDISFTLSNAPGALGTATATGQQGNVSGTGLVTFTTGSPVRFLGMGRHLQGVRGHFSITGDTILMEAIGGGQPSQMIAPAIADGGTYASVNNGFRQFRPLHDRPRHVRPEPPGGYGRHDGDGRDLLFRDRARHFPAGHAGHAGSRAFHLGDDASRLRRSRLCGLARWAQKGACLLSRRRSLRRLMR